MKQQKGNGNKPKGVAGIVSIVRWALLLTFLFNSCQSAMRDASTVEVDYSTFKQWVRQDMVEHVHMASNKYTITLKEGVEVELGDEH